MRARRFKRYWAYVRIQLFDSMAYKFNLLSSFLASIIEFIIMLYVWSSVFQSRSSMEGFSYTDMITYLCIAQGITAIYGWNNAIEGFVSDRIRKGDIIFDLLKPVYFNKARFAEGIGSSLIQVLFVVFLLTALYWILPGFHGPAGVMFFGCFLLSVLLGYLIMSCISLMVGLLSFVLMNYWGIYYVKKAVVDFFSGSLVPLIMLPGWLRNVCEILPFSKIVYTPTMIYLGRYQGYGLFQELAWQAFWCIVLAICSHMIYKVVIRKVTINGG